MYKFQATARLVTAGLAGQWRSRKGVSCFVLFQWSFHGRSLAHKQTYYIRIAFVCSKWKRKFQRNGYPFVSRWNAAAAAALSHIHVDMGHRTRTDGWKRFLVVCKRPKTYCFTFERSLEERVSHSNTHHTSSTHTHSPYGRVTAVRVCVRNDRWNNSIALQLRLNVNSDRIGYKF